MTPPFLKDAFPRPELSGRRSLARSQRRFWHGEAETDLATLGGGTGLAAGALHGGLMGTQAADFFKDAVHFETGFETLESAVNGFAFADLNFSHGRS